MNSKHICKIKANLEINKIEPGIEDCFMRLIANTNSEELAA